MQKVKIVTLFVKQQYEKNIVTLPSNLDSTAKMLTLGIAQASLALHSLNRIIAPKQTNMNIKSIITAAVALLASTACSGGAKQEKVMTEKGNGWSSESHRVNSNGRVAKDEGEAKSIVVFFSHAGDNYAVGNIEVGNTKIVADYISELAGADQFEIVTHKYDGMAYTPLINLAKEETKNGELPEYEGDVDLSTYDTVFIGGPVWWGTYPQVMFTFFKKHAGDLKGKTVIPFTTHEGSGLANCVEDVKAAFAGANVTKGFSIYGHEVRTEKAKVEKWLKGLGY